MEFKHDPEADAIYIKLNSLPYAYGVDLDNERRVDYSEDRTPIGIELLCVSNGIDVTGLPKLEKISELLRNAGFSVYSLRDLRNSLVFNSSWDFRFDIQENQPVSELEFNNTWLSPQTPAEERVELHELEVIA